MSILAVAALVLMLLGMLAFPLIPSLTELRNQSDAKPLSVIQEHAGEIRHFASGFRNYISGLRPALQQCVATGTTAHGVLPDGCEYLILGKTVKFPELKMREKEPLCELVLLAGTLLKTPDNTTFAHEIYAGADLIGGENCTYRAILGEKNIRLAPGTTVMRWVHSLGTFQHPTITVIYLAASLPTALSTSASTPNSCASTLHVLNSDRWPSSMIAITETHRYLSIPRAES